MSNFFFKSLTQKAKSKTEPDSKSILVIESAGLAPCLENIVPELSLFYMQVYESAVVPMDREVLVHVYGEELFQGIMTKVTAKKTETATTFQIVIEAMSREEDGKIFAYLGDDVDCELSTIQHTLFDKDVKIAFLPGEKDETN